MVIDVHCATSRNLETSNAYALLFSNTGSAASGHGREELLLIGRARVLKILRTFTILSHDYLGNQKFFSGLFPASLLQFSLYQPMATNSFRSREAKEQKTVIQSTYSGGREDGDEFSGFNHPASIRRTSPIAA